VAFADNLQQLRKQSNLSQEKLAEQLHITRQAISKWESGQSVPDADTCLKLCEIFAVSPNQLLWGVNFAAAPVLGEQNKANRRFDDVVFPVFLMVTLFCGTALLICNLYNGHLFEPHMHVLAVLMICGSIIAFACTCVARIWKKRRKL